MPAPKGFRPPAAGKGRVKGSKNVATKALKEMILGALSDAGGQAYLSRQAVENPGPFLALIGKVLPTTIAGDPNAPLKHEHTISDKATAKAMLDRAFGERDK